MIRTDDTFVPSVAPASPARSDADEQMRFEGFAPAKAGDPVFQRRQRLIREAAAYWIPRMRGG